MKEVIRPSDLKEASWDEVIVRNYLTTFDSCNHDQRCISTRSQLVLKINYSSSY